MTIGCGDRSRRTRQPARAKSIVNAIAADVGRFVGNAPQSDDQTMLVVRYHGPDGIDQQ